MILTIDFGTTVTKVGIWGESGLAALARSELTSTHPQMGWTEQDPLRWWTTVVIACAEARAQAPEAFGAVDVVACSGARQTFVPVTAQGDPVGKGILWSDRRASAEARQLAERMGETTSIGLARVSRSTPVRSPPNWPGWPSTNQIAWLRPTSFSPRGTSSSSG